jgi:hypothetical protein
MNPYSPIYGLSLGRKILKWVDPAGLGRLPYEPSEDAPSTYSELIREYNACLSSNKRKFRVYSGGCETSIYGSPEANHAFRYMHDFLHCTLQQGFDLYGETKVARQQGRMLGCMSVEDGWTFGIDTIGQALYSFLAGGRFLEDQEAFVHWCYEHVRANVKLQEQDRTSVYAIENDMQLLQLAVHAYHKEHS